MSEVLVVGRKDWLAVVRRNCPLALPIIDGQGFTLKYTWASRTTLHYLVAESLAKQHGHGKGNTRLSTFSLILK